MTEEQEINDFDPMEGAGAVVVPLVFASAVALVALIAMVIFGWPPIH